MVGPFRILTLVLVPVLLWSCSITDKAKPHRQNADLFRNPEKHVGEHIVVQGFMRYKFENRNLFPSEQQVDRQLCLPVLIKNTEQELIEKAEARDGDIVEIKGKIVHAARPGMVSATTCKQVGIEVQSIR